MPIASSKVPSWLASSNTTTSSTLLHTLGGMRLSTGISVESALYVTTRMPMRLPWQSAMAGSACCAKAARGSYPSTAGELDSVISRASKSYLPMMARRAALPLHPSRATTLQQGIHLGHRGAIEIAHEGMLQATRRHGEFQRLLVRPEREQPVDQAPREAVAAAHAIHNVGDLIVPAHEETGSIVHAGSPPVVRRAFRFPQRDGDGLHFRVRLQHPRGQLLVLPDRKSTRLN